VTFELQLQIRWQCPHIGHTALQNIAPLSGERTGANARTALGNPPGLTHQPQQQQEAEREKNQGRKVG
jgi:hypothetical protein